MAEIKEYKLKVTNEVVGLEQIGIAKPGEPIDPAKASEKLEKETAASGVGKTIAIRMGQQALSYAIGNYGNLTGDYVTQERIQAGIEMIGLATTMITGGPIGIAFGVGVLAIKAIGQATATYKNNLTVDMLRLRTGMIGYSGGRY